MEITKKILPMEGTELKDQWQALLLELEGHPGFYGSSKHRFNLNTTVAQSVLQETYTEPCVKRIDLLDGRQLDQFISSLKECDRLTFDEGHNIEFLKSMLKNAVAIGVYDKKGNLIGGMWGIRTTYPDTTGQERTFFHVWWLAISPEFSGTNTGRDIMNFGETLLFDLDVEFVSLNTNHFNGHIQTIARERGFKKLAGQNPDGGKFFMIRPIDEEKNGSVHFDPNIGSAMVRKYVLENGSVPSLVFNQVQRSHVGRKIGSFFKSFLS